MKNKIKEATGRRIFFVLFRHDSDSHRWRPVSSLGKKKKKHWKPILSPLTHERSPWYTHIYIKQWSKWYNCHIKLRWVGNTNEFLANDTRTQALSKIVHAWWRGSGPKSSSHDTATIPHCPAFISFPFWKMITMITVTQSHRKTTETEKKKPKIYSTIKKNLICAVVDALLATCKLLKCPSTCTHNRLQEKVEITK